MKTGWRSGTAASVAPEIGVLTADRRHHINQRACCRGTSTLSPKGVEQPATNKCRSCVQNISRGFPEAITEHKQLHQAGKKKFKVVRTKITSKLTQLPNMGYTLYVGNKRYSSWSMRPWVLLKALSIPFDESLQHFKPGWRQPEFIAFSPSAKVPCLHDSGSPTGSADESIRIWDSLAICEYVAESHPSAWPSDRAARAFARSAAAEMHSGFEAIRDECSMNVGLRIQLDDPMSEALAKDIARIEELWKEGLARFGGPWIAGATFSVADAFFAPVATRVQTYGITMGEEAMNYVQLLLQHPAVDEWVKGGIEEEFREPDHEVDSLRGRKVLEDLCK
jgi:glutathione S-transferase